MNESLEAFEVEKEHNDDSEEHVDLSIKHQIYVLFEDPSSSTPAFMIAMVINLMIIVSTATFICETIPGLSAIGPAFWEITEIVCVIAFTIDFCVRIVTCPDLKHFVRDPMNWIDFIAILPFYIELIVSAANNGEETNLSNLRLIRVIRLARVLRIFKMSGSGDMGEVILEIVKTSVKALGIPLYFLIVCLVVWGSLVYYLEKSNPVECGTGCDFRDGSMVPCYTRDLNVSCCYCLPNDVEYTSDHFASIPHAFWWVLVTMTTVGYGDKFPRTWPGKIVGIFAMISGVVFLAMPLTIIGTSFNSAWEGLLHKRAERESEEHVGEKPPEHVEMLKNYFKMSSDVGDMCTKIYGKSPDELQAIMDDLNKDAHTLRLEQDSFAREMTSSFEIFAMH